MIYVGSAGWNIPRVHKERFPATGSGLQRYAARLNAAEINSSFYRPHRPATYAKWAAAVPADFRFAVKVPRAATHERRLTDTGDVLERFLGEVTQLGDRLGPLLVQLPPSLALDAAVAEAFFADLRGRFTGNVVVEPRHRSWFTPTATRLITAHRVARVAADPAVVPAASEPGGWDGLVYYRLHGSPKVYFSNYDASYLDALAARLTAAARRAETWCVFDNTADGWATANALDVLDRVR